MYEKTFTLHPHPGVSDPSLNSKNTQNNPVNFSGPWQCSPKAKRQFLKKVRELFWQIKGLTAFNIGDLLDFKASV